MLNLLKLIKISVLYCEIVCFIHSYLLNMINDNPNLKPIYYAFLPNRLIISILKSIPIGFAYKVIDDMEDFDLGKRYIIYSIYSK